MVIRKNVADKLSAYLHHELKLEEWVDWAENVMMESDFEKQDYEMLRDVVSRLGLADVKAFGLTWEDCKKFLNQLGYAVRIEVVAH